MNKPNGSSAAQQQTRRLVANPYLKKAAAATASVSVPARSHVPTKNDTTTHHRPGVTSNANANNNVHRSTSATPNANRGTKQATVTPASAKGNGKKPINGGTYAVAATPKSQLVRSNNPYQKGVVATKGNLKKPAVTPTPKKQQQQQSQRAVAQLPAPSTKPIHTPKKYTSHAQSHAQAQSQQPSSKSLPPQSQCPKQQQPPIKRAKKASGPTTLKSQLKSQIAQLALKKKQFLAQKQAEKERIRREKEEAKARALHEAEMKRQAKLREEQRLKQEGILRRQRVGSCMNGLLSRVEHRMELEEKNGGVHFAIGEAMEGMISTIEMREKQKQLALVNQRKREEELKRRKAAVLEQQQRQQQQVRALNMNTGEFGGTHPPYGMPFSLQPYGMPLSHGGMYPASQHMSNLAHNPSQQPMPMGVPSYAVQGHSGMSNNFAAAQMPQPIGMYTGMSNNFAAAQMQQPMGMHTSVPPSVYNPHPAPGMTQLMQQQAAMPPMYHTHQAAVNGMPQQQLMVPLAKPAAANQPIVKPKAGQSQQQSTVLHSAPITDAFSPYKSSHHVFPAEICITKKAIGESFGATLRFEAKSALVPQPQEQNSVNNAAVEYKHVIVGDTIVPTAVPSAATFASKPKKPRRKRVNFGVLSVVQATKATYPAGAAAKLCPGDIVLQINGKPVGGLPFGEACKAIGTTSTVCPVTGVIRCVLKVARMNLVAPVPKSLHHFPPLPAKGPVGHVPIGVQPLIPIIPFNTDGGKVVGEFSAAEWAALVRGMSTAPTHMFSMALVATPKLAMLDFVQRNDDYRSILQRRSNDIMRAKLNFETNRNLSDMREKFLMYWKPRLMNECVEDIGNILDNALFLNGLMTDSKRSELRMAARPEDRGCKCGSKTHNYVNDPKCTLYRDVKQFCQANSIATEDGKKEDKALKGLLARKNEAKTKTEQRFIERYLRERAENRHEREEATYVLKMEKVQSSRMNKAVFAPSSLCVLVLSAVVKVMEAVPEDGPRIALDGPQVNEYKNVKQEESKKTSSCTESKHDRDSDSDSDDSDSDDDDVPLTQLLNSNSAKRAAAKKSNSPPSKRPKPQPAASNSSEAKITAPHPYFLAEILKHIGKTHGHLFKGEILICLSYIYSEAHVSITSKPSSEFISNNRAFTL